jgi:hypothetical protein
MSREASSWDLFSGVYDGKDSKNVCGCLFFPDSPSLSTCLFNKRWKRSELTWKISSPCSWIREEISRFTSPLDVLPFSNQKKKKSKKLSAAHWGCFSECVMELGVEKLYSE